MLNNKCFLNEEIIDHFRDNFFQLLFPSRMNCKRAVGQIPKGREIMFDDRGMTDSHTQ